MNEILFKPAAKNFVLTIAGTDSSCAAGSFVDATICHQLGTNIHSVITAVTAQNSSEVHAIEFISAEHITSQLQAIKNRGRPDAIKIGMLGSPLANERIIQFLNDYSGPIVLDPVIRASSGTLLCAAGLKQHLDDLKKFFPLVTLLTPNILEAELLLNCTIRSYSEMEKAAGDLLATGIQNVLIKGGHLVDSVFSQDYWTNGKESLWIAHSRFPVKNYRGTGCTLSSAITACFALGHSIKDALVIAKMYTHRGIRLAQPIDANTAHLDHGGWPDEMVDLPYLSFTPLYSLPPPFPPCPIRLYPIVESSHWVERLLSLGVKTIQLRIKNSGAPVEAEIQNSILLAKKYKATLFINDYWEYALQYGADGVHLGQEDMQQADIERIRESGLFLGISTHCYYEIAQAHRVRPSYLAYGPIYPTTSKLMPFSPQGIAQLQRIRRLLDYPLVAIGGINLERVPDVLATGVQGIALISAITQAHNPHEATQQFLKHTEVHYA